MITMDGWLSWAERVPGPIEKQYTQPNSVEGYIPHSMVGTLNGWYSRLFDMSRTSDGRFTANAAASVQGSILLNGHVIQHFPLFSSCWASGNREANTTRIAFENESMYTNGMPDETIPFTELQLLSNVRIIEELSDWKGWIPSRSLTPELVPATLMGHNEAVKIWGGHATACPSDRTEWEKILFLLREEEDMEPVLFTVKLPSQETWLVDGKGFHQRVTEPGPLEELRQVGIAKEGPSIVLSREAIILMGIPENELR